MSFSKKERADLLLVSRGLAAGTVSAQALILAGRVWTQNKRVEKPGQRLSFEAALSILPVRRPFVSRGGQKLAGALDDFSVAVEGKVCLDVGSSTGGFTDCLLQRGAATVICLDVGRSQLAWELRQNPRVVICDRCNVRFLQAEDLSAAPQLVVADLSFISLSAILPALLSAVRGRSLGRDFQLLALVKPQFEAPRGCVGNKGIVGDTLLQQEAVEKIQDCLETMDMLPLGVKESVIRGARGNREFFLYAQNALPYSALKRIGIRPIGKD